MLSKYFIKRFWQACKSCPFCLFWPLLKLRGCGGVVPGLGRREPEALDRVASRLWGECGRAGRVAQTRYTVVRQHLDGRSEISRFDEIWDLVIHGVLDAHAVGDEERWVGLSHVEDLHHLNLGANQGMSVPSITFKHHCRIYCVSLKNHTYFIVFVLMYLVCSVCVVEAHDGLLRVCDGLDASQGLGQLPVHVVQAAHRVRPGDWVCQQAPRHNFQAFLPF